MFDIMSHAHKLYKDILTLEKKHKFYQGHLVLLFMSHALICYEYPEQEKKRKR